MPQLLPNPLPQLIQDTLNWYEWRIRVAKLHENYYQAVELIKNDGSWFDNSMTTVLMFDMKAITCVICTENCNLRRCISFKRRSEYPPYLSGFAGQSRPLQMLPIRYFWSSGSDNMGGFLPKE